MLRVIRSVLAFPVFYQLWWNVLGGPECARVLVREYMPQRSGARILEIGCGPGTILPYLLPSDYTGFDLNSKYIDRARTRFPQAQFVCAPVSQYRLAEQKSFDAVLAIGIVHHLDDEEARQLFQIAYDALKTGGKLVTMDGVSTTDQSPIVRWLLEKDRGKYVRDEAGYLKIASQVFTRTKSTVRSDLAGAARRIQAVGEEGRLGAARAGNRASRRHVGIAHLSAAKQACCLASARKVSLQHSEH